MKYEGWAKMNERTNEMDEWNGVTVNECVNATEIELCGRAEQ